MSPAHADTADTQKTATATATHLPHHGDDGAAGEVAHQAAEERLLRQIGVVLLGKRLGGLQHLDADLIQIDKNDKMITSERT